jgi:acyl-coenzyme A synthetase/AMP-(fatty) acid ligase
MLPNRIEQLALHLAAFRLGVPLVRLSASYAPPQIAYCLRQTQPRGLVVDGRLAAILAQSEIPDSVRRIWNLGNETGSTADFAELLHFSADTEIVEYHPDEVATITFTSGTTARPKGVIHSRAAVGWAVAKSMKLLGLGAEDVTAIRMPLHYQVGLLVQCLPTLVAGGRVELLQGDSAAVYVAALQRPPAKTVIFDSPTLLMQLFRHEELRSLNFTGVRWLLSGGDFVPQRLQVMARELVGRDVAVAYGLTEAGLVACRINGSPTHSITSVGSLLSETEVRIADDLGRDVRPGDSGQIFVRSQSEMSGYWEAPELTHSVLTRDGWIATGDVGFRGSDGELVLHGRIKEIIVCDGKKISPLEVEAALMMHPAVREVGVTGVTDVADENHGVRVEAFVILRDNFEPCPSEVDLRKLAAERLAAYMVPERIHFVRRLPLHPTGKLDRRRLWMSAESGNFDEGMLNGTEHKF